MKRFSWLILVLISFLCSLRAEDVNQVLTDKRMLQNVCAFKAPSIKETQTVEEQDVVIVSYVGMQRKPQRLIQTRDWGPNNIKWRIKSDKTGEIAVTGFEKLPENDVELYNGKIPSVQGPCLIAWKIDEIIIDKQTYDLYTVDPVKAKEALNNRSATKNLKLLQLQNKTKNDKKANKGKKSGKGSKADKNGNNENDEKPVKVKHNKHDRYDAEN